MATVDAHEYVFYNTYFRRTCYVERRFVHTGVGFCVARSNDMGNAKASECGTGNGKDPTLFSFMVKSKSKNLN